MRMKTIHPWIESQQLTRYKLLLTARREADQTASPDNSRAITESPQRRPGFQVNPPVHHNGTQQQTAQTRRELNLAQSWGGQQAHILRTWKERRGEQDQKMTPYLSMMTGSEGVSFLFPQLFLSQHRLWWEWEKRNVTVKNRFKRSLLTSWLSSTVCNAWLAVSFPLPPPSLPPILSKSVMELVDDHGHVCRCWLVWFSENRTE